MDCYEGTNESYSVDTKRLSYSRKSLQQVAEIISLDSAFIGVRVAMARKVRSRRGLAPKELLQNEIEMEMERAIMKTAVRSFWWLTIVAVLGFAPGAFAQDQNDIQVDLTSVGNGVVMDDVYVSPYVATVNGVQNTQVICDDFADESQLNTGWNANTTQFSNLSSEVGRTLWGSWLMSAQGGSMSATAVVNLYEQAAWLSLGLIQQVGVNSTQQGYYSYAIWAVFDPTGVKNWLTAHNDTNAINAIFGSNGLLAKALLSYASGNYSNFVIITPLGANGQVCTPAVGGGSGSSSCPAQEFFMQMPEGGAALIYLLLAGLSCIGAIFFRSRQRAKLGMA